MRFVEDRPSLVPQNARNNKKLSYRELQT